jgi:hypothetical protein
VVRTTLGAEVDTTVTVSGSESVEYISADFTPPIAANTGVSTIIRPPNRFVYELLSFRMTIDSGTGDASGNHSVLVRSETEQVNILAGKATGDQPLQYDTNYWQAADISADPDTTAAQVQSPRGVRADSGNGYEIFYNNNTANVQNSGIAVRLWLQQIEVSE